MLQNRKSAQKVPSEIKAGRVLAANNNNMRANTIRGFLTELGVLYCDIVNYPNTCCIYIVIRV